MNVGDGWDWELRKDLVDTIKEILFDSEEIDPEDYDKSDISAAKSRHSDFNLIDDEVWFTTFRRAACEYNLQKDHEEVESRHFQPRGRFNNYTSKSTASKVLWEFNIRSKIRCIVDLIFFCQCPQLKCCTSGKKQSSPPKGSTNTLQEKSISKELHTQIMSASPPTELVLPHVVSDWMDTSNSRRSHVLIALPSGMRAADLLDLKLKNSNSVVVLEMKWPMDLFSASRILSHSRYNNHYHHGHPKWIALQDTINKAMGTKKFLHPCLASSFRHLGISSQK